MRMMVDIYRHGQCTLVWLGPSWDDGEVERAMTCIRQANDYVLTEVDRIHSASNTVLEALRNVPAPDSIHPLSTRSSSCFLVERLFSQPWFQRIWVLQEVGVSKRATAFCGRHYINLSELALFCKVINDSVVFSSVDVESSDGFSLALGRIIGTFGTTGSWLEEQPLLPQLLSGPINSILALKEDGVGFVLHTSRAFLATDPRDHVFALLGHPIVGNIIEPDYALTLEQMHLKLVEANIKRTSSLDILRMIDNGPHEMASDEPSWVPAWHRVPLCSVLFRPIWDCLPYPAAKAAAPSVKGSRLFITGFIIDEIARRTQGMELEDWDMVQGSKHIMETCWEFFHPHAFAEGVNKSPTSLNQDVTQFLWTINHGRYPIEDQLWTDCLAFSHKHCSPGFHQFLAEHASRQLPNVARGRGRAEPFADNVRHACNHRRLFATANGRHGLASMIIREGDIVVAAFGCRLPLVLRRTASPHCYRLVATCYVYGIMDGEGAKAWMQGKLGKKEQIILV